VFKRLRRRFRALVNGSALDGQLDQELQFHLDLETRRRIEQGASPEAARTAALRTFGGVERVREECRDARRTSWAETIARNTRYAVRTLLRQPGYLLAVVVTLGLGIGANTAIFSVVNGVLLKPLPYPDSDRLVLIEEAAPRAGQDSVGISIRELYDYREQLPDFEGLVEFHSMNFDLLERGEPDRVATGVVSANFFSVLGVQPVLGRTFMPSDEKHGAHAVLVLSYDYWQRRFGGDPHIVGQVFEMNDRPHTVVGILPAIPEYPRNCDVYMPTSACPFRARGEEAMAGNRRAFGALTVVGRLKPGITIERAQADVAMVASRFTRDYPRVYTPDDGFVASAKGLLGEITKNARPMLLLILGATGLVLLLACANVASLMLARTLNRERELALRAALGASRAQLTGQLLTESLLLALAGGLGGLLMARGLLGGLTAFIGRFTARTGDVGIDLTVLAFALVLSLATGLAFGALPALVTRPGPAGALKQAGATTAGGPRRRRLQSALVVAQVAVSVVLLVGAGLLLTSFYRLDSVDAGYHPERVLSAEVFGNFTRFTTPEDYRRLYLPVVDRLAGRPGVVAASVASVVPLGSSPAFGDSTVLIEGQPAADAAHLPKVDVTIASDGYFDTLQIPILRGRPFRSTDSAGADPVVVISTSTTPFWNGRDPLGTRVSLDDGKTWASVVGIVPDVHVYSLEGKPQPQLYIPLSQTPTGLPGHVLVRTTGNPVAMASTVRDIVRQVDPNVPVKNVDTLEAVRSQYLERPRLTAILLLVFAGVALMVTLAGLAGVMATSVSQRAQEFGVRLALGARPSAVVAGVLRQGGALLLIGLAIGIAGASLAGRVLTAYLFETQPTDPLTFLGVAAAMTLTGLAACLGPARRATAVDPLQALRSE
jgi:putative ABC transport system permease protein